MTGTLKVGPVTAADNSTTSLRGTKEGALVTSSILGKHGELFFCHFNHGVDAHRIVAGTRRHMRRLWISRINSSGLRSGIHRDERDWPAGDFQAPRGCGLGQGRAYAGGQEAARLPLLDR